jgi:hypothetical protein
LNQLLLSKNQQPYQQKNDHGKSCDRRENEHTIKFLTVTNIAIDLKNAHSTDTKKPLVEGASLVLTFFSNGHCSTGLGVKTP